MCQHKIQQQLLQLVVISAIVLAHALPFATASDTCWSSDQECLIHATLHQTSESGAVGQLPMQIDCLSSSSTSSSHDWNTATADGENQFVYLMHRRFEGIQNITLDGCHTPPFGTTTYGFDFIPNCDRIAQVTIERFHADALQQLHCPSTKEIQAEIIVFRHNEIGTITADAFVNLRKLREVYFLANSLRHIDASAFDALRVVELIHIEREPLLTIKEYQLLQRTSVLDVRLNALKRVTPQLFQNLPESLRQIHVEQTHIDGDAIELTNPQTLQNISIIGCALNSFMLFDQHASVLHMNLSGNGIVEFAVEAAALETLDLSANQLQHLDLVDWLSSLKKLRYIVLRNNLLKTVSLPHLCSAVPSAQLIDLSDNKLAALRETSKAIDDCEHTRIRIDRNPWSCMWLLDFAHTYPEKFRMFLYDKFISQINVNGLACNAAENSSSVVLDEMEISGAQTAPSSTEPNIMNTSTYTLVYGNWDLKRNQRAEALIIVFMLPLGIAFLFLLLYMWIHCQKMFHMSYYRTFSLMGHHQGPATSRSAERFDRVRNLATAAVPNCVPNNNDDYETPLHDVTSACNCNNIGQDLSKCHKSHHITYESLPSEQPYKIYEEIIEDDGEQQFPHVDNLNNAQPVYDHLVFAPASMDKASC